MQLQFPRMTSSGQHRLPLCHIGLLPFPYLELELPPGKATHRLGLLSSWTSQLPHTFLPFTAGVVQPQRWDTGEVIGIQAGWSVEQRGPNK